MLESCSWSLWRPLPSIASTYQRSSGRPIPSPRWFCWKYNKSPINTQWTHRDLFRTNLVLTWECPESPVRRKWLTKCNEIHVAAWVAGFKEIRHPGFSSKCARYYGTPQSDVISWSQGLHVILPHSNTLFYSHVWLTWLLWSSESRINKGTLKRLSYLLIHTKHHFYVRACTLDCRVYLLVELIDRLGSPQHWHKFKACLFLDWPHRPCIIPVCCSEES